jgi:hypothetical protein
MSAYFSPTYKVAYSATRNFSYRDTRELCLFLEPCEEEVGFGVSAAVTKEYMHRVNRHLKNGKSIEVNSIRGIR